MSRPDKLSIVVFSGEYDRIHYALAMASAAAAIDRPVTLLFTMGGIGALLRKGAAGAPDWAAREAAQAGKGIATVAELLDACAGLGATFLVCDMGLRAMGIDREALRDDLTVAPGGAVSFLNDASGDGAMLFV